MMSAVATPRAVPRHGSRDNCTTPVSSSSSSCSVPDISIPTSPHNVLLSPTTSRSSGTATANSTYSSESNSNDGARSPFSFSSPASHTSTSKYRRPKHQQPQHQLQPQKLLHSHNKTNHKQKPFATACMGTFMILLIAVLNVFYTWSKQQGDYDFLSSFMAHEIPMTTTTTSGSGDAYPWVTTEDAVPATFPFPKPPSSDTSATVVFYHVFFPSSPEGRENSARIIQEQLKQLQSANRPFTLYYNTIGERSTQLDHVHIQSWCQQYGITCYAMHHYAEGMEDKTLQRLHDFCTVVEADDEDDDVDYSAIYIHNKGSFTTKPVNEAWRYQMTQAVTSPECLQSIHGTSGNNNDTQCNLCGLYFTAERGMFMAGNMWHTKCSYVKQLIPPKIFPMAMETVTKAALMERLRYKLLMTMQELRAGVFGVDRYATEFWVASHPTVKACDFSGFVTLKPTNFDLTDNALRWLREMGPNYQIPLQREWFTPSAPRLKIPMPALFSVSKFKDVRLREYFLLAGNLFRWYHLYDQAPPLDSWVYEWFPDGDQWRTAVAQHGRDSVDIITTEAMKEEAASKRNRYTADHSKIKIGTTAPKGGTGAGGTAPKVGAGGGAPKGSAKAGGALKTKKTVKFRKAAGGN